MNNQPPLGEGWPVNNAGLAMLSTSWSNWIHQIWLGLSGWKKTFNATKTYDFGAVSANATLTGGTVTIVGVRTGDGVQVTPLAKTSGIIYDGVVTANDTVTLYANNITTGSINPASTIFRVIVFQN